MVYIDRRSLENQMRQKVIEQLEVKENLKKYI